MKLRRLPFLLLAGLALLAGLDAALLPASLLLRLAVGDVRGVQTMVQLGGALNIAAVLTCVLAAVWSTTRRTAAVVTP